MGFVVGLFTVLLAITTWAVDLIAFVSPFWMTIQVLNHDVEHRNPFMSCNRKECGVLDEKYSNTANKICSVLLMISFVSSSIMMILEIISLIMGVFRCNTCFMGVYAMSAVFGLVVIIVFPIFVKEDIGVQYVSVSLGHGYFCQIISTLLNFIMASQCYNLENTSYPGL